MTLKLTLKPGEAVYIGLTRLTVVSGATCTVLVDGNAPVLRSNEMVADTCVDLLDQYRYLLQQMYLSGDSRLMLDYVDVTGRLAREMPALSDAIFAANSKVRDGRLYDAIKIVNRYVAPRASTAA